MENDNTLSFLLYRKHRVALKCESYDSYRAKSPPGDRTAAEGQYVAYAIMLQIKNAGTTVTSIYMRFVNASMLCTCRARENQRFNWALLR